MPISTSRGCPFDCIFCSVTKIFGRKYRFRSAENIITEMKSRHTRSFFFVDDNITVNKPRAIRLFEEIVRRNINVEFKVSSRIDRLDDDGDVAGGDLCRFQRLQYIGWQAVSQHGQAENGAGECRENFFNH